MKAKELIKKMKDAVAQHGDIDVYFEYYDDSYGEFFTEEVDFVASKIKREDDDVISEIMLLQSKKSEKWKWKD